MKLIKHRKICFFPYSLSQQCLKKNAIPFKRPHTQNAENGQQEQLNPILYLDIVSE